MIRHRLAAAALAVLAGVAVAAPQASAATSSFTLETEPDENYQAIYGLINNAQSTIDMTMYELADTTAQDDLVTAAGRGVTVRVILDQNREQSNNQDAYDQLSQNGVQVVWAPSNFAATHQKTITVDGTTTAIMTGNLTSRYYSTTRDFAVMDTDQADIGAIEKVFDADFADNSITPADGDDLVWSPTDAQTKLIDLIKSATSTLDVENEEMSDSDIVDALVAAAKRGVTVYVTMNDDSSYDSEFTTLTNAGALVHVYPETTTGLYIHAKVIVVDAALSSHNAYQGSINFSDYSLNQNRELGLITTDTAVDASLEKTLASDFSGAKPYSS